MSASNWVHLEGCNVLRVTDKAMLVEYDDGELWLPLSQIDPESRDQYEEGDEDVTVSITLWLAKEKGIET
jgi:hypothetical protein